MLRKFLEIVAALLLAALLAVSYAFFPANAVYYGILAQGFDIRDGIASSHLGWLEKTASVIASLIWSGGGNIAVRIFVGLFAFILSLAIIWLVLRLTRWLAARISHPRLSLLLSGSGWIIILVLALFVGRNLLKNWGALTVDTRLFAPLDLLEAHQKSGTVFFNPYARRYIRPLYPQWIPKDETSWRQAVQNPALWRKLDRSLRFDLVLLSGPPTEFQPLLEHLQSSPDWQLVYLDNGGMAFARKTDKPEAIPLPKKFTTRFGSKYNKALALAQAAMQCAVLHDYDAANALLRESEALDKDCPEIYSTQALISLQRKNWDAAIRHADEALERDPSLLSAIQVKAKALMETRSIQQAYSLSREIIGRSPDDFYSLLLHARIANTAHAYESESNALERAIQIAEENGFPTAAYRVFLGQSYAKQGLGPQAIEQFELALKDPTLTEEQKQQVNESLSTVRQRSGLAP